MNTLHFSIRAALRKSWELFAIHPWFYLALTLVMMVLNIFGNSHRHQNPVLMVIAVIASIIWSYVWISVLLASVKGNHELLTFHSLKHHLPNFRQFFSLIGVGLLSGLIIVAGFICLIIPGIYFMTRLAFANFAYVDKQEGIVASLRTSWHMVKGKVFWTVFLVLLTVIGLLILGAIAFGAGVLLAYPLAMLMLAQLYQTLKDTPVSQVVVEQPIEIPPVDEM